MEREEGSFVKGRVKGWLFTWCAHMADAAYWGALEVKR